MTTARTQAPTLAWLLFALSCLLVGLVFTEARYQTIAVPTLPPVRPDATGKVTAALVGSCSPLPTPALEPGDLTLMPAPTPILGPGEPSAPSPTPRFEEFRSPLSTGPAILRVIRLTVPPGIGLPPEVASGSTVLLGQAGVISVLVDSANFSGQGLDPAQIDAVLSPGERLFIVSGAHFAVRNDGPTTAEAFVVTIASTLAPIVGGMGLP